MLYHYTVAYTLACQVSTYHYEIKPITHNDQEGIQVDNDADTVEDWKL